MEIVCILLYEFVKMESCDIIQMLNNSYEEPRFFIDFQNLGRGLIGISESDKAQPYIKNTKSLNYWRIVGDTVQTTDNKCGNLFDEESYIFQWIFEYSSNDLIRESSLFYYWRGRNATKGYSPLPKEIEKQNPVVERICQWSEPAVFFHLFPEHLIVFSGIRENFNASSKRLLMVRGELACEIHLYEVPCLRESLRSRAVFVLIDPETNSIYYWYGSAISDEHHEVAHSIKLNTRNIHWTNFNIIEVKDGYDDVLFFDALGDETGMYTKLYTCSSFTPRLFYFNSITGDFLALEIEYPLKSKNHSAAFPFLQSHLYTANQPAIFLLDNDKEIWLWEGWKTADSNLELFEMELQLAKETARNYAKAKSGKAPIPVRHVLAGHEPPSFVNIFPYWNKR